MRTKRTRAHAGLLRSLADLSTILRLFLALWDHWRRQVLVSEAIAGA